MKKQIRLFATLMVCMMMALCVSCKKDDDKDDKLSSEEKMLIGTWRRYDNYCAAYGSGWTDKLVLNSDHTCLYDGWWACDGSCTEYTRGTWSYNASNQTLTWNTITYEYEVEDVNNRPPFNETRFIISLSETNMTLAYFDGDMTYWTKQ